MSEFYNNIPQDVLSQMDMTKEAPAQQTPVQAAPAEYSIEDAADEIANAGREEVQESPGFISDTFNSLTSGEKKVEAPVAAPVPVAAEPTPAPKRRVNPLDNIVINLDTIEIVEKSPLQQQKDFDAVFNAKATYQVVAVQSGYSAEMSALNMQDINNITNSNVDLYTHKRNVYQAVHAHLERSSVGKLGFTDWLKITSYHDFETLLYGIYCQTFPEANDFTVTCGSCGKQTNIIVNNETLVETRNQGLVMSKIDEIVRNSKTPADLVGKSLVHTNLRTILPESKMVIDIQTPSLWDHLEMLRTLDPKVIEQYSDSIGIMLFMKNMYMLDVETTLATGNAKYYEVKDRNKILSTLTRLSMKDGKHIEKTINDRIEQYAITYSVKNAKCTHCSDSLGTLPVDIETALFTLIGRERQA